MSWMAKKEEGFRFEHYSTAEEAQAALLKLHPVGSDVGELIKTLKTAGASCTILDGIKNKPIKAIQTSKDFISCGYIEREFLFFASDWQIAIYVNREKDKRIKKISIYSFFQSL